MCTSQEIWASGDVGNSSTEGWVHPVIVAVILPSNTEYHIDFSGLRVATTTLSCDSWKSESNIGLVFSPASSFDTRDCTETLGSSLLCPSRRDCTMTRDTITDRVGAKGTGPPFLITAVLLVTLILAVPSVAENIDPNNEDSQRVWAENIGWINAEPGGDGGDGVQVDNLELSGWMWGENVGWASLSCTNTGSCATVTYGVTNDKCGNLVGYAWAENVGWINFAPATAGVTIDPTTGDFSGHAWGENVGWISFASGGSNPFKVKTAWRRYAPTDGPDIDVDKSGGDLVVSWSGVVDSDGYDVIEGSLFDLRMSGGDFTTSPTDCLADGQADTSYAQLLTQGSTGDYYLVRAVNCGGKGTADSDGDGQIGLRDTELAASSSACP